MVLGGNKCFQMVLAVNLKLSLSNTEPFSIQLVLERLKLFPALLLLSGINSPVFNSWLLSVIRQLVSRTPLFNGRNLSCSHHAYPYLVFCSWR